MRILRIVILSCIHIKSVTRNVMLSLSRFRYFLNLNFMIRPLMTCQGKHSLVKNRESRSMYENSRIERCR